MEPNAPPSMPPMNSVGAKMPPAAPLEYEKIVATTLSTHITNSTSTASLPPSASDSVS
jgi:hypothetical protein